MVLMNPKLHADSGGQYSRLSLNPTSPAKLEAQCSSSSGNPFGAENLSVGKRNSADPNYTLYLHHGPSQEKTQLSIIPRILLPRFPEDCLPWEAF